tara:strand:+ start:145 stop:450 length:306 start_codon:yes stop_codon:yes gene_type:complete
MRSTPHLQFMDRAELRAIVEEHGEQELVIQADADVKEFFSTVSCPECCGGITPIINAHQPFKPNQITPNFLGQCTSCGCEFDPYTSVIVRAGSASFQHRHR